MQADADHDRQTSASTRITNRSTKAIWIMTYGASASYINTQMLLDLGNISADECHSTTDGTMNYTYIHLIKSIRQTTIEKFMEKARKAHGVIRNEVYGYSSIAGDVRQGERLDAHVGFQMLVKHFVEENEVFQPWTDGESILKRGRILKAVDMVKKRLDSIDQKSKPEIIAYVKMIACENSNVKIENKRLKRKIDELEKQLSDKSQITNTQPSRI